MSAPQTVPTIGVFDYIYDETGVAVSSARVYITLQYNQAVNGSPQVSVSPVRYSTETDTNGFWTLNLVPNPSMAPSGTTYAVSTPYNSYEISVPASAGPYQTTSILVNQAPVLGPALFPAVVSGLTVNGNASVTGNLPIGGPRPWVDVTASPYGADPTGTNDSTGAIQLALTAGTGGTVYFPPGTYKISLSSTVPNHTALTGSGTVIYANGTTHANAFTLGTGCSITGLTIDGNGSNQTGPFNAGLVSATSQTNLLLSNCTIKNSADRGVLFSSCTNILIEGCAFTNCGTVNSASGTNSAIQVSSSSIVQITGNQIVTTSGCGVSLGGSNCSELVISNNYIKNPFAFGIACGTGTSNCVISGNRVLLVNGGASNCIDLGNGTSLAVTGNVMQFGNAGISCAPPVNQTTISGNTVLSAATDGIFVGGGVSGHPNNAITGNVVIGCGHNGINAGSAVDTVITGNTCKNNSQATSGAFGGIEVDASNAQLTDVIIANNRSGDDQVTKTQGYGIRTANFTHGASNFVVTGNDLSGNLTAVIGPTAVPVGAAFIRGNVGINPVGNFSAPTVPASGSPSAAQNYDSEVFLVTGASTCAVTIGSTATGLTVATGGAQGVFRVPAGQTVTLTYTSAPTWKWFGD